MHLFLMLLLVYIQVCVSAFVFSVNVDSLTEDAISSFYGEDQRATRVGTDRRGAHVQEVHAEDEQAWCDASMSRLIRARTGPLV